MSKSILLNLILVILPLLFMLHKRAQLLKDWKAAIASWGMAANLAYLFTFSMARFQMVTYGANQGAAGAGVEIPVASVLFCITFPFFGLTLYRYLNILFPKNELEKYSLAFSNILMGLCVAVIFFAYTKVYPVITFSLLLVFLLFIEYKNKIRFMYPFYRAYGVLLVLYAASQFLFRDSDSAIYKAKRTVEFNIAGVPFENYFLIGVLLLLVVYLFEYFKRRNHAA